jgi:hypothetical protein
VHEANVGHQSLTPTIARQIAKDAELLNTGQVSGVTWHFFQGRRFDPFRLTHGEVAGIIGQAPHRARRNQYDASDYDLFRALGVFIYYDADDKCQAVEFTRGAKVSYDGYELFAHPAHEARAWARARDQNLDDKDGFVSSALGLI